MRPPILATVVLALAVAGCGSSDSGDAKAPKTESAQTKAEFTKSLDAVCKEGNDAAKPITSKIAELSKQIDPASDDKASIAPVAAQYKKLAASIEPYQSKLRDLEPPSSEKAFFDEYLALFDKQVVVLGRLTAALDAADAAKLEAAGNEVQKTATRRQSLVADHGGLKYCGSQN